MGKLWFVLGLTIVLLSGALVPTTATVIAAATADDLACADFATQAEARAALAREPDQTDALDGDGDGVVCESLPEGDAPTAEATEKVGTDPLAARLGGTRSSFEAAYGEANEDGDVPRYDAEGYGSVLVLYAGDRAGSVTVVADRPLDTPRTEPDAADWTVKEAHEQAKHFLPTDAELDDDPDQATDGEVVVTGRSAAVAKAVSAGTYKQLGMHGEPGDVRYTLFLTEEGGVSSINLGLGTGEDTHGEATTATTAEEGVDNRCEEVAPEVVAAIEAGLTIDGGGSLRGAQAVKSKDFAQVWFVAADLDGAGLESSGDIGVWATNDIGDPGSAFSVNAIAKAFSRWGDGAATDASLGMDDDGAAEAVACVSSTRQPS